MLSVDYSASDSTKFQVKPITFLEVGDGENEIHASFTYNRPVKGRTMVTCTIEMIDTTQKMIFTGISLKSDKVDYFASTFDYPNPMPKGKDKFVHNITFFVPELDFQKMTENNSIVLKLNDINYEVESSRWNLASKEIEEKGLLK